ncbi:hypothetical protein [Acidocella sp. KAb 2-4]|uniref:hypothetical protein n=1 Tax=Acidocella sp. KAb 2-4 TaxID=2885158 RepID=UPI001D07779D|nr:hypothetical protein [Acidocella sp. KAb 2-4]MCB5943851.1 hypothetical protein [Acidocella sp. KAb 2-4]
MTLLWTLLILTFIFSAIFMLPTRWYTGMASWVKNSSARQTLHALEQELTRQAGQGFSQDISFFAEGVGLALDRARKLVFIAVREDGKLQSAVVPFSAVVDHTHGEKRDSGFYDYYVDVTITGAARPVWRLLCGENPELAARLRAALDEAKV